MHVIYQTNVIYIIVSISRLYSSSAQRLLVPVTFALGKLRNLRFFNSKPMLGPTLNFKGSKHWVPYNN